MKRCCLPEPTGMSLLNPGSVAELRRVLVPAFCRAHCIVRWCQVAHIARGCGAPRQDRPKSDHDMPSVTTAAELLTLAAERGGPIEFARIATLKALNRHRVRQFTGRKDPSWRRRG